MNPTNRPPPPSRRNQRRAVHRARGASGSRSCRGATASHPPEGGSRVVPRGRQVRPQGPLRGGLRARLEADRRAVLSRGGRLFSFEGGWYTFPVRLGGSGKEVPVMQECR